MVTVRRATPEDKDAIHQFLKLAYPGRWQYKFPERWQWEYVDNPFLPDSRLPVWIAVEEDGRVVGQTCALVEPLLIGGQLRRVGWSVDTFLLEQYRGQGIGFQLQKANDEANEIFMSLSMSNANRRIKAGLGSVALEPVPGYTRLVTYTPESLREAAEERLPAFLKKAIPALLRVTLLDRLAAAWLNLGLRRKTARQPAQDPDITITPLDRFGEDVNVLWEKVAPCFYAIIQRDQVYLNWKFVDQPFARYHRFAARRGAELCGYIVLRRSQPPERDMGIIADLLAAPQDEAAIRSLLGFAVRYFEVEQAKDILAASSVKEYQASLGKFGFEPAKVAYPMFHARNGEAEFAEVVQPGRWFLGKADHDWDQFPLAR